MREVKGDDWLVTIERTDSGESGIVIFKNVPNDELEYAVDEALKEARNADIKTKGTFPDGAVL